MIKIALKHFIYEKCIDVIFNAIINNFKTPTTWHKMKVGDRFNYITIFESPVSRTVYYGPEVVMVENDYFVISGKMFTEIEISDMFAKETDKDYYAVSIDKTDKISISLL